MNILITGASSFLGRVVVSQAIDEGYYVYGVIRPDSTHKDGMIESEHFHIISEDMHHIDMWNEKDIPDIDICIHLSWSGIGVSGRSDAALQKNNVDDTLGLIKLLGRHGCKRFIMAGSQAEYGVTLEALESGGYDDTPIDETYTCNPISEYGKAKLKILYEGSKLCEELDITYIHARIFSVYGPGDHSTSLIETVINKLKAGEDITLGPCRQMWNYIYVTDCARAMLHLAACTITRVYQDISPDEYVFNIASEHSKILREYAEQIKKVMKSKATLKFEDRPIGIEGTPYLYPSINKICKITGYKSKIDFEDGIKLMISKGAE